MGKDLTLFNDFWDDVPSLFSNENYNLFPRLSEDFEKIFKGKCDFEEHDDKYIVELELPGVKKDEVNINLKNDILTISWKRSKEIKKGKIKNKAYERSVGSFTRSFNVEGADPEKIDASLKNGVLSINLLKHENAKPKKIEIK